MGIKFASLKVRGFDISQFNGVVNWAKFGMAVIMFLAIRVGYGKTLDKRFKANWAGAKGLTRRLAYWYLDYYSNHKTGTTVSGFSDEAWGRIQAETRSRMILKGLFFWILRAAAHPPGQRLRWFQGGCMRSQRRSYSGLMSSTARPTACIAACHC